MTDRCRWVPRRNFLLADYHSAAVPLDGPEHGTEHNFSSRAREPSNPWHCTSLDLEVEVLNSLIRQSLDLERNFAAALRQVA